MMEQLIYWVNECEVLIPRQTQFYMKQHLGNCGTIGDLPTNICFGATGVKRDTFLISTTPSTELHEDGYGAVAEGQKMTRRLMNHGVICKWDRSTIFVFLIVMKIIIVCFI